MTKISEIDVEKLQNNEILLKEYSSILAEVEKQASGSVGSVFAKESNNTVSLLKFITGGVVVWFFSILCLFIKGFKNFGYRVLGFFVFSGIGCILGLIAKAIPTIANPLVNYIGFPVLLVIIVALLATGGKNKNDT